MVQQSEVIDSPVSDKGTTPAKKEVTIPESKGPHNSKILSRVMENPRYSDLSDDEKDKVSALLVELDRYYKEIPNTLQSSPDIQKNCLSWLLAAERELADDKVTRQNIIQSKLYVTEVEIELARAHMSRKSFLVVAIIIYLVAILVFGGFSSGLLKVGSTAETLNQDLVIGIPMPVWIWAMIGSLTSMLLRAGQFPFADLSEAMRWLLFRPLVGVIMGALTYLMVIAGLIVFAGSSKTETPELIWVIAFVGSFSDTLSIQLLHRVLGQFKSVGTSTEAARPSKKKESEEKNIT